MVPPTIRQCPTKTDGLLKLYLVGEDPGGPPNEATLALLWRTQAQDSVRVRFSLTDRSQAQVSGYLVLWPLSNVMGWILLPTPQIYVETLISGTSEYRFVFR